MRIIKGNIITLAKAGEFDAIVHGCNCFCTMGSGLAPQIKNNFPCAWKADLATTKGDESKLGGYSYGWFPMPKNDPGLMNLIVVNAYTQHGYGPKANGWPPVDYNAIQSVLKSLRDDMLFEHCRNIGLPKIGCGLAGGEWEIVEEMILDTLGDKATIVVYDQ